VFVWPVFVGFLIWGAVVVRRTIRDVEGPDAAPAKGPAFKAGWANASGLLRAAFIAMGVAVFVWAALILFVPWAVAMGVVARLVWHRPYLEVTLGRLLVLYAFAGPVASVLSFRGDGGPGAIVVSTLVVGLPALIPGLLLLLAARSQPEWSTGPSPSSGANGVA